MGVEMRKNKVAQIGDEDKTVEAWQAQGQLGDLKYNTGTAGMNFASWMPKLPTYAVASNGGRQLWVPVSAHVSGAADYDAHEEGIWWAVGYSAVPYPGTQGQGAPPPQGGATQQDAYDRGYADERQGRSTPDTFTSEAYRQSYLAGRADAKAGLERRVLGTPQVGGRPPVLGAPPPAPAYQTPEELAEAQRKNPVKVTPAPPPGQILTAAEGQVWYQLGYADAVQPVPPPPRADFGYADLSKAPAGTAAYYYWQGYQAGAAVRPTTATPPPLAGLPPLNPSVGAYELYATVPLAGDFIVLRGVPLNVAEAWGGVGFRPKFYLLGDRPGDAFKGFRLAGPTGTALRTAQQQYPGQTSMQATGLAAWVAAVITDEGILESLFRKGAAPTGEIVFLTADQLRSYLAPRAF